MSYDTTPIVTSSSYHFFPHSTCPYIVLLKALGEVRQREAPGKWGYRTKEEEEEEEMDGDGGHVGIWKKKEF